MSIRLVLSDLDGTLLAPDRTISDAAVSAIARVRERGAVFTFVTGRPLCAVERFIARANITPPVIACNGGIIAQSGRVLSRHPAPLAPARALMERASALGWTALYYTGLVEYAMSETAWTRARALQGRPYIVRVPSEREWNSMEAEKINLISGDAESGWDELRPLIDEAEKDYSVVRYGEKGTELTAANVSKASALTELSGIMNIPVSDMMAIGDAENDVQMLRLAGTGVAVGNACEHAKASADYICRGEYTEGVIEALTRFIL